MRLSEYLATAIQNKILMNTPFTVSQVWLSLHSSDPGQSGAGEITAGTEGGSYSRKQVSGWLDLPRYNLSEIVWTNTPYVRVTHMGMWDAPTAGNFLMGAPLIVPQRFFLGERARFAVGSLITNMLLGYSFYTADAVLNKILANVDFDVPALYGSLHTDTPGTTGANEEVGSGGRQLIPPDGWTAVPSYSMGTWISTWETTDSPFTAIQWSGLPDVTFTHIGFWDAITDGHFLLGWELSTPVNPVGTTAAVTTGDNIFARLIET